MTDDRDPAVARFERDVRHDAVVHRIQAMYRMRALMGSSRTWWTVRALLRNRRESK